MYSTLILPGDSDTGAGAEPNDAGMAERDRYTVPSSIT